MNRRLFSRWLENTTNQLVVDVEYIIQYTTQYVSIYRCILLCTVAVVRDVYVTSMNSSTCTINTKHFILGWYSILYHFWYQFLEMCIYVPAVIPGVARVNSKAFYIKLSWTSLPPIGKLRFVASEFSKIFWNSLSACIDCRR